MEIIITDDDRAKYGTSHKIESLVLHTDSDKFTEISKPISLPRIPSIYDMRMENNLSENDKLTITNLSQIYPKINFDNISPLEASEVEKYSADIKNMTRKQIWDIIKPFFNSVFTLDLGDTLSKMTEIARRNDNNPNYIPTTEWLAVISQRILNARQDLFTYNIDLNAKRFDYRKNPIETLMILMKIQKEMYPKRNKKLSATFFDRFNLLIQSHAELMIKLKINDKTGEDFFGSKYNKIRDQLRILKAISYKSFGGKPLTIKQTTSLINIIDDYKKTLEMIFVFNEEDRVFFNEELCRPLQDIKLATLEIYHTFDDSSTSTNAFSYRLKADSQEHTSCEIINSIFLKTDCSKKMNSIYKNGIQLQSLSNYISQYFHFNKMSDGYIIRQKALKDKTNMQTMIIEIFFNILDKYKLQYHA